MDIEETAPLALISGGVGLTPMMSMLDALVNTSSNRKVTFIHSARNETLHAFAADAMEMTEKLSNGEIYYGYENPINDAGTHHFTGYISQEFLAEKDR